MGTFGRERHRDSQVFTKTLTHVVQNNYAWEPERHSYRHRVEVTRDSLHPDHPKTGGPLDIQRAHIYFFDVTIPRAGAEQWGIFSGLESGPIRCTYGLPPDLALPTSGFSETENLGPQAWSRFRPAKPDVQLGTFLAELRDLPSLMFKRLTRYKNLGSNYLAVQFGWKPFLSDLSSWYNSIKNVDKHITQLMRDNGNWIKRRGNLFENENLNCEVITTYPFATLPNYQIYSNRINITEKVYERAWFSGSFRYYIPGLNSKTFGRAEALLKLWDLDIGPEQLWQLIPFSWLVDWFSNVGTVIGNYSAQMLDNLVSNNAYVMLHRRNTRTVDTICKANYYVDEGIYPYHNWKDYSYTFVGPGYELFTETKSRSVASPFGFQIAADSLNAYQLSILTALGISRSKY